MIHREKMEVTEGQDVALPCILRPSTAQIHVVNMEWTKGREAPTKLLVYNPMLGSELFERNITLQVNNNKTDFHLTIHGVTSRDSGIYICVLSTYPLGNIIRETELKIRGKATLEKTAPHQRALTLNCPLHIFHVAADCVRVLLLCPSHQLFNFWSKCCEVIARRHLPQKALFCSGRGGPSTREPSPTGDTAKHTLHLILFFLWLFVFVDSAVVLSKQITLTPCLC